MSYGDVNNCFFPLDLYYRVQDNTWVRVNDDGSVLVGMTDIAQTLAGSILHATPQKAGKTRKLGKPIAIVESSKWVGPVKAPMAGTVIEANAEVQNEPSIINKSPYKKGWLVKLQPDNLQESLSSMLTGQAAVDAYRKKMEDEGIEGCVHCEGYEI